MADLGRREIVSDPLALNPREQGADRSLPTYGIRNPQQSAGDARTKAALGSLSIIDGLQSAVGRVMEVKNQEAIVNGKLKFVSGVTEQEIAKSGNRYETQGWQAMNSASSAQEWFTGQAQFIEGEGAAMDPDSYRKHLMQQQKEMVAGLPNDPAVRKTWLASFEDLAPRLMSAQVEKNNEYNENQSIVAGSQLLYNSAGTQPDASVPVMGGTFRVNMEPVEEPVEVTENDRDVGIRTLIGEAGAEGPEGMAAVAHVLINRLRDKRYPKTIQEVALQDSQFSTWNAGAGGNNPGQYNADSEIYKRAGKVFDAVMGGLHVDPTAGATHYYSDKGMSQLVDSGTQSNLIPKWWDEKVAESGGSIRIGGHQFSGRSTGYTGAQKAIIQQTAGADTAAVLEPMPNADGQTDPVIETVGARPQNGARIQKILASLPLKSAGKAVALANAIERSLADGDDTLFNDAGGISALQGLNAPMELMDKVLKAKDRFDTERDKKFDVGYEKARADVLSRVQSGEFATLNEALNAVDELHTRTGNSDAEAKALARAVEADWRKADRDNPVPLELRDLGAELYDGIESERLTARQAAEQIQAAGKRLGVKPATIENFVASMYSKAESEKNSDRSAATAEMKRQLEEQAVIAQAHNALARNSGLKGLKGNVRIPDPVNPGRTKTVSGEEYGVWALKNDTLNSYLEQYRTDIKEGRMDSQEVASLAARDVYEKLSKQQVYDKQTGNELASAVIGNLLTQDGKGVRPEASQALDFYMQMRDNANVGTEYLNSMIDSDQAKSLLETAAQFYDGQMDINAALLKASERLNTPMDASKQLDYNSAFFAERDKGVQNAMASIAGRASWFSTLFGESISPYDYDTALSNTGIAESYIQQKATVFHMQNPREPMDVSVKRASDALATDGVIVGGSLVVGKADRGQRLDQVMGIEDLGKTAPDKALKQYLEDFGEKKWQGLWKDGFTLYQPKRDVGVDVVKMPLPAYEVTYNPQQKVLEINLYKDATRTTFIGEPMVVPASIIGNHYKNAAKIGETSELKEGWRGVKEKMSVEIFDNLLGE